jgi:peptidoglycan biosynthesis protein MviN/MurJ (putative lipid II flippase)
VLNIGITLRKRTVFAPLVIAIALAVNVALNFLLIPRYGAFGATVSTLASYVVFCALRYWASNLFIKIRYEWGRVFTILTLGAALIFGFYITDYLLRGALSGYPRTQRLPVGKLYLAIFIKLSLALSFPLLLFALGFYDEREKRRLREIRQRLFALARSRRWSESWLLALAFTGAAAAILIGWMLIGSIRHS